MYAVCGCLYYKHQVDTCPNYRRRGHDVKTRKVLVGYSCPKHSSSAVYREPGARPRGQAREESQSDTPRRVNRSESPIYTQNESYTLPATDRSDNGQAVKLDFSSVSFAGPVSYPTDTDRDGSDGVPSRCSPLIEEVDEGDIDQGVVDIPDPGGFYHSESELQTLSTWTAPPGEIGTRRTPSPGETTCPHHLLQNLAACPRECGWNVEQTIERGDVATDISRRQLHHLLTDSLMIAFANLSRSVGSAAVTQSSDYCRSTNSHKITDTVQLDTLQSDTNPEPSTSSTPQLPAANLNNLNEADCPPTATCHTRKTKKRPPIPPCYLLIFLGLLTVIGSLVPGLWRASSRNDLSGGFTLAQYILGVGIFVVGSMVAIHSKTCECWKTHTPVDQVVGAGH